MSRTRGSLIVAVTLAIGVALGAFVANAYDQEHMDVALEHLQQARAQLQQGAHDKGGHRARAVGLVDQAINEVREGIQYANQHPHGGKRRDRDND